MKRRSFIQQSSLATAGVLLSNNLSGLTPEQSQLMVIKPDWSHRGSELRHTWEGLGNIDQMRWMTRKDCLEHLEMAYTELNMRHVRAVGIHHDDLFGIGMDPKESMTVAEENRKPRNNWQVIDYIFDSLLDIGINPMYTTAFTPSVMASGEQYVFQTKCNVTPPKNYNEWAEYIEATLRHFKYRYGKARMDEWYYEVWNEPNLNAFYGGDQAEFFKLWEVTSKAIKNVDSDWRIGGPSTARAEWIESFLDHTKAKDCYPEYLIAHCYNNDSEWAALSPFDGLQEDRTNKSPNFLPGVVKGVDAIRDKYDFNGEIHWNEWGRSWFPYDEMRETANEAAFIVKSMAEVHNQADYFAYWCLSDIYNQAGYGAETFHGNYGLLNLQGLKKPSYFAFQLLGMMGDTKIPHVGEQLDRTSNAFISRSKKGQQVLLYSFDNDYKVGGPSKTKKVKIALPDESQNANISIYEVSNNQNNVLTRWKTAGSPEYLTYDEKDDWRRSNNTLKKSNRPFNVSKSKGNRWIELEFETPGIMLVDIS